MHIFSGRIISIIELLGRGDCNSEYGTRTTKTEQKLQTTKNIEMCFGLVKKSHLGANGLTWDPWTEDCTAQIGASIEHDSEQEPLSEVESCVFQGNFRCTIYYVR